MNGACVLAAALAAVATAHTAFGSPPGTQRPCPALSPPTQARLVQYVHQKYKIPQTIRVNLTEVSRIDGSCQRKVRFQSADAGRAFRVDLYLSPDLRFLSTGLMDTTTDPVKEEAKKREALLSGLTQGNFPSAGPNGAPATLVVFSDFQCPYCASFSRMLKNEVLSQTGERVRLVFRHFPLSFHSWARAAAEAASCAQDQNGEYFWRLHDFFFDHQGELTRENLRQKLADVTEPSSWFRSNKI